jgi:hypothetical protein
MSVIDRQRITAVKVLDALGYTFADGEWHPPSRVTARATPESDRMHALLVERADALDGCIEGSPEAWEREAIADVHEAYEAKRWPAGKECGGKG